MSQLPNYAAEGRIKAVCAENGVLADCLDDIALQFREGKLSEAELPAKIKEWKATPDHHYFHRGEGDDKELFVRAFGEVAVASSQGRSVQEVRSGTRGGSRCAVREHDHRRIKGGQDARQFQDERQRRRSLR